MEMVRKNFQFVIIIFYLFGFDCLILIVIVFLDPSSDGKIVSSRLL